MKNIIPVAFAVIIGLCNIPILYGYKKAFSANPLIFAASFNLCSGILLFSVGMIYGKIEARYFTTNWHYILAAGLGILLMNALAYHLINRYGASYWFIASLSATLLPPLIIGYLVFRERINLWVIPAVLCAVLSVIFFAMSKR